MGCSTSKNKTNSESPSKISPKKSNNNDNPELKLCINDFKVDLFSENSNSSSSSYISLVSKIDKQYEQNSHASSLIEVKIYDADDDSLSIDNISMEEIFPEKKENEEEKSENEEKKEENNENEKNNEEEKKEENNESEKNNENEEKKSPKKEKEKKKKKKKVKKNPKPNEENKDNKDNNVKYYLIEEEVDEEEEESSEFESEKIDSPHPSELIDSNKKEMIYSEYKKNKKYLSPEEKKNSRELHEDSYDKAKKVKYKKNILLHNDEITSICSFDGKSKDISYATSSLDKTIKLWNKKFKDIGTITNLFCPSLYICEFDKIYILSAEGLYINMYDISTKENELVKTFRDHVDEINIIVVLVTNSQLNFISGGRDKILRLWSQDNEKPIRYYEGHTETITLISKVGNSKKISEKLVVSISEDNKCILWELSNSNLIMEFQNYYTAMSLIETPKGFCIGSYDNKLRFFNTDNYSLDKCYITKFYGNSCLLLGDEKYYFTVDYKNNINLMNLDKKDLEVIFEGPKKDIVQIIKCFDWDPDNSEKSKSATNNENRKIIAVSKDGYVYSYNSDLFGKMKTMPKIELNKSISEDKSVSKSTNDEKSKESHHHSHHKDSKDKKDSHHRHSKDKKESHHEHKHTKPKKKVTFSDI